MKKECCKLLAELQQQQQQLMNCATDEQQQRCTHTQFQQQCSALVRESSDGVEQWGAGRVGSTPAVPEFPVTPLMTTIRRFRCRSVGAELLQFSSAQQETKMCPKL